jgi:hypothetical protein
MIIKKWHTFWYFVAILASNANGLWQLFPGEGNVDCWAADDDFNIWIDWTSSENFAQFYDAGLIAIHFPVSSNAEFTTHV